MKKRFSVKEFQSYISKYTPSKISFWSENQEWYTAADPFKIKMIFSIIAVGESPNIIYLKDETKKEIFFDRVKYICVDDSSTVLGAVFHIHCDKNSHKKDQHDHKKIQKNDEIVYTLVAS